MAPSRRQSNVRSTLVNRQRQITSFFSKSASPSLVNSNPTSDPNPSPCPTPFPATPSPRNPIPNKPLLLIGAAPLPSPSFSPLTPPFSSSSGDKQPYGQEVVGRRIKVYWPLDKAWYEGRVKSFDKVTGQLLVRYDDDDEEEPLDVAKEKIEWVQDTAKKLKRLRHGFPASMTMVMEDDEEAVNEDIKVEERRGGGGGSCEDCRKNEVVEEAEDHEEYMKLENEENEDDIADEPKGKRSGKVEPRKLKVGGVEKLGPAKSKSKGEVGKGGFKVLSLDPASNLDIKKGI